MRFRIDLTWNRLGDDRRLLLAGSPFRAFRLTDAGARIVDAIERGDDVADSALIDRLLDGGAIHPQPSSDGTHTFDVDDVTVITPQLGGEAHPGRLTIDDGSTPPIVGATHRLDRNLGPAGARNAGRSLATTPVLAFVDADVFVGADVDPHRTASAKHTSPSFATRSETAWLEPLLAHFDDPRVGLVAPRVIGDDGTSLDLGAHPGRIRAGSRVSYVPAAAIVVRAEAFDDIGGFDERLRFGEDVDLVWRLDDAGWRCRYEPQSAVWHRPRPTLVERLRQQVGYGSSSAPLALRHPRALAPFRSTPRTAAAIVAALAGSPSVAMLLLSSTVLQVRRRLTDITLLDAARIAMTGNRMVLEQFISALRRTWWPVVAVGAVASRRLRWLAVIALAIRSRRAPTDIAFGWGLWSGMLRHRTLRPIIPDIVH
ncbi:MAG: glycosyltransferase family 2 protein [Ilumatobacter sp.]|uniref:glycosyltransferase family 2 protein n=1 Tax=Ilumatobacter sp. TaxID=1967498 RepID=UPI003919B314